MDVIDKVKMHARVSHSMEDPLIQDYIDFAKHDVIEAVYDSHDPNLDKEGLGKDPSFQKAVIMLSTYYYEVRVPISDRKAIEMPFSVTHAIQTLRAHRDRYLS